MMFKRGVITPAWIESLRKFAPTVVDCLNTELELTAMKSLDSVLSSDDTDRMTRIKLEAMVNDGISPDDIQLFQKADQNLRDALKASGIKVTQDKCTSLRISFLDVMQYVLAIGITWGFFDLIFGIANGHYVLKDSEALTLLVGSLTTAWLTIIGYIYGTSISSRLKDQKNNQQDQQ